MTNTFDVICFRLLTAFSLYLTFLSDYLLSLSVEDRRQYYWTTDYKPLDEISVWTPTAGQTLSISHSYHSVHKELSDSSGRVFQESQISKVSDH